MIDGLGCRRRQLAQLVTDIVQEGGLGEVGQIPGRMKPAGEVQQVISVSTQRTQRELANALGIEEGIDPDDFLPPLILQAIRRGAGRNRRAVDENEFHTCWARSQEVMKSAAVAPATK